MILKLAGTCSGGVYKETSDSHFINSNPNKTHLISCLQVDTTARVKEAILHTTSKVRDIPLNRAEHLIRPTRTNMPTASNPSMANPNMANPKLNTGRLHSTNSSPRE